MKLSEDLIKILQKKYEPSTMVSLRYKGNDIVFKTDKDGNAIQLFAGKKNEERMIKGYRYIRTLLHDKNGLVLKDHWDLKGKST
ncbi:MAG TPA: hypothetical protein VKA49_13150 [Flavitalea sp.]|nr:hypothetical protein [Flavitalea sp.]